MSVALVFVVLDAPFIIDIKGCKCQFLLKAKLNIKRILTYRWNNNDIQRPMVNLIFGFTKQKGRCRSFFLNEFVLHFEIKLKSLSPLFKPSFSVLIFLIKLLNIYRGQISFRTFFFPTINVVQLLFFNSF